MPTPAWHDGQAVFDVGHGQRSDRLTGTPAQVDPQIRLGVQPGLATVRPR